MSQLIFNCVFYVIDVLVCPVFDSILYLAIDFYNIEIHEITQKILFYIFYNIEIHEITQYYSIFSII